MNGSDERDLAAFFGERLDEDEAVANAGARRVGMPWSAEPQPGTPGGLVTDDYGLVGSTGGLYAAEHIARHDPARVLRDVEGDRALLLRLRVVRLELLDPGRRGLLNPEAIRLSGELDGLVTAMQIRARRFDDHPDWKPQWMWGA